MPDWILTILDLPPEGSVESVRIDALHLFVISVTMVSSVGVFLMAAYFVVRYRRRDPNQLTERRGASWWSEAFIAGSILSLFMLWWVIGFRQYVAMRDPPSDAMTVYVTAKQWMWKFTYPDGRSSNDVLTVPAGRPVKLAMISRDVIHSFYVPAFREKQDVLPGRYTTLWFDTKAPGSYPIFCAELCGVSHSLMRGQVDVLAPDAYEAWLRAPTRDASGTSDLVADGRRIAETRECVACHTVTGASHVGPTWVGLYDSQVKLDDGRTVTADDAYLTRSMMEPNVEVVAGYKSVMPSYFGVLEAPEVAALVEYIKSLREPSPPGVELPTLGISPIQESDAGPRGVDAPPLPARNLP